MAAPRMTIVFRVKPGRMADFVAEQQGWKDRFAEMSNPPRYTADMMVAGTASERAFDTCATVMEFESMAHYGEFMESLSADMVQLADQGSDPEGAADMVNVLVSERLVG